MNTIGDEVFLRRKKPIGCKTCKGAGYLKGIVRFSGKVEEKTCPVCKGTGEVPRGVVFLEVLKIKEIDLSSGPPVINRRYYWGRDVFPTYAEAHRGELEEDPKEMFPKPKLHPGKDFPEEVFYARRKGEHKTCTACNGKNYFGKDFSHICPFCDGTGDLFVYTKGCETVKIVPKRFWYHCNGTPMVDGNLLNSVKYFTTRERARRNWKKLNKE